MKNFWLATLDDIVEMEKTPIEERLYSFNTYELFKKAAAIDPDSSAISFFLKGEDFANPIRISYREFIGRITQTANLLNDLEIGPNDVVSYLLPNLPETHYILWGAEAAGIANPINYMLEPSTIVKICQAAGTKVLVTLGECGWSEIWEKSLEVRRQLPGLKAVISIMAAGDEKNGIYGYEEVIDNYDKDRLNSGRVIQPEDIASLYHTGGTTGTPKLAPHTHFNEAAMSFMTASLRDLSKGEAIMCGLPLFHVNGTTVTGLAPFYKGAHVVILGTAGYRDPMVIKNFYKIVEFFKAVSFSAVPTLLAMLLDVPKKDEDISSLRYVSCGAAPLSVELFNRFEAESGMKIMEGYGLTEGTCVSACNPYCGERKVGSIGLRIPYQEMGVFIVDEQGRFVREARTDEIGAVSIKGPNVFRGYTEENQNKGVWPKDGWFNTGDLGRKDSDGYFWLTGRKKELIIRGGHNIDPATIEEPLYSLPGIQVAAAVGKPDPHAGEVPVAYVQVQQGADLNEEKILDHLRKTVGERAAVPKEVFILNEIPLTSVGKIFKPALKWDSIRRVYYSALENIGDMAKSIKVTVNEDKVHGALAIIEIKPAPGVSKEDIINKVEELLTLYTVRYDLIIK
ncbi:acyl-CoA synthetase [Thermodesulfobacteriota bacterium]